jgi:hypothetical protein
MEPRTITTEKKDRTPIRPMLKVISMDDLNALAKKVEDQDGDIDLFKLVNELKKIQKTPLK